MTPTTLRALRQLLFFSVDEAAAIIGHVTPRSWQYWEAGRRTIPADVIEKIENLCAWRKDRIEDVATDTTTWYATLDEWEATGLHPMFWRPQCSVVAEGCARYKMEAVPFTKNNQK